jgi:hypothetical protein
VPSSTFELLLDQYFSFLSLTFYPPNYSPPFLTKL